MSHKRNKKKINLKTRREKKERKAIKCNEIKRKQLEKKRNERNDIKGKEIKRLGDDGNDKLRLIITVCKSLKSMLRYPVLINPIATSELSTFQKSPAEPRFV